VLRFHSKAGADILMLQGDGEAVLRALGREPAPQGIFEPGQISELLATFASMEQPQADEPEQRGDDTEPAPRLAVRAWPLLQLLRRAALEGHPVIWSSA
jgi:hypothetical protein